jgi:hypothetical protein
VGIDIRHCIGVMQYPILGFSIRYRAALLILIQIRTFFAGSGPFLPDPDPEIHNYLYMKNVGPFLPIR